MPSDLTGFLVRPFDPERDTEITLQLINHDRVMGQPTCTEDMLKEAIAGRSAVDSGWWQSLEKPKIVVLTAGERVMGVASYAVHREESSSFLLWMHTREEPKTTAALTDHFLRSSDTQKVLAFYIATALTSGLEALPARHRAITHSEMLARGFKDIDLWRYMHIHTPIPNLAALPHAKVEQGKSSRDWRIAIREDGRELGFVHAGSLFPRIGVVWLIQIEKEHRGKGLGRKLLGSALAQLTKDGAQEIILYVDDDESGGERDKTAANRLYDSLGFREVDRLHSYEMERQA